ncbi:hypothetical protein IFR05_000397 [Cadophora sp. M221]|nr:hypothetical protein IFR05_000397 [Cadophora sp. M221]
MFQMVEDVKKIMRGTDPVSLTQAKLDGFKLRWWNCEHKYMEDNIGNGCEGINELPRRDYDPRAGECDSPWEEDSDEEYDPGQ